MLNASIEGEHKLKSEDPKRIVEQAREGSR